MDNEKKQLIFFSGLIILLITGSIIFFVWKNFIAKGTLILGGEGPYEVYVNEKDTFLCELMPCEIKLLSNSYLIKFTKQNHIPVYQQFSIGVFDKIDYSPTFKIIPEYKEIPVYDIMEKEYDIVLNPQTKMQMLIEAFSPSSIPISYFPNELVRPKWYSSHDTIIVFDLNDTSKKYLIDLKHGQKKSLFGLSPENLSGIIAQPNSTTFVYWYDENESYLYHNEKSYSLGLNPGTARFGWAENGNLVFITRQGFTKTDPTSDIIELLKTQNQSDELLVGKYNIFTNSVEYLWNMSGITELPEKIIPSQNLSHIDFKFKEQFFRLTLRKF